MARQSNPSDMKKALKIADAASSGNLEMLKLIGERLSKKKKEKIGHIISSIRKKDGHGALHFAAGQGYAEICNYLIEKFAVNVNMASLSASKYPRLITKTEWYSSDLCVPPDEFSELFVVLYAPSIGKTPICFAANFGNPNAIKDLINLGANVNVQDVNGFSPLHDAVIGVKPQALEVLLSRGAQVNMQSFAGSPLLLATTRGDMSCMKVLLDHNADPNEALCKVVTPLLVTVMNNEKCLFHQQAESKELAELLIKAGADVNKVPVLGLAYHSKELMEYLLGSGADPNLTDKSGMLPIIVAALRGKQEIVEILFPLTTPIPTILDWTIDGLFNYIESQEFKKEREVLSKKRLVGLKKKIQAALNKKEHLVALILCTFALEESPEDASDYYTKRSRCWMHLGNAQCGVTSFIYKLNSALDASLSKSSEDIRNLGKEYLSRNDHVAASFAFAAGLRLNAEDFKKEIEGVMDSAVKSGDYVLPGELEELGNPAFTTTLDLDKMVLSISK